MKHYIIEMKPLKGWRYTKLDSSQYVISEAENEQSFIDRYSGIRMTFKNDGQNPTLTVIIPHGNLTTEKDVRQYVLHPNEEKNIQVFYYETEMGRISKQINEICLFSFREKEDGDIANNAGSPPQAKPQEVYIADIKWLQFHPYKPDDTTQYPVLREWLYLLSESDIDSYIGECAIEHIFRQKDGTIAELSESDMRMDLERDEDGVLLTVSFPHGNITTRSEYKQYTFRLGEEKKVWISHYETTHGEEYNEFNEVFLISFRTEKMLPDSIPTQKRSIVKDAEED